MPDLASRVRGKCTEICRRVARVGQEVAQYIFLLPPRDLLSLSDPRIIAPIESKARKLLGTAESEPDLICEEPHSLAQSYFDDRRTGVDPFVRRHFTFAGTLGLHRSAVGWDLARAPINVLLAPVYLSSRLAAWALPFIGLRRAGAWLHSRPILLRTDVARRIEALILEELLAAPGTGSAFGSRPQPAEHDRIVAMNLHEYGSTRSAVGEITTSIGMLGTGAAVSQAFTPGILSLAPIFTAALANSSAVAAFPLGALVGSVWYDVFPADAPFWLTVSVALGLAAIASVVTTFSGVIADPLQLHMGIHRRRLLRLIDTLEAESCDFGDRALPAREHYIARVADIADAGLGLIRVLRT